MRYLLASAILLASASAAFGEVYAPAIYRPVEMSQNDARPLSYFQRAPRVEMVPPSDTVAAPVDTTTDSDSIKKSILWMNF